MSKLTFKFLSPKQLEENFAALAEIKHDARLEQIQLIKSTIINAKMPNYRAKNKQKLLLEPCYTFVSKLQTLIKVCYLWSADRSQVHRTIYPTFGVTADNPLDEVSSREALLLLRKLLILSS